MCLVTPLHLAGHLLHLQFTTIIIRLLGPMPRSRLIVINVIREVITAIPQTLVLVAMRQNTIQPIVPTTFQLASQPIVSFAMVNPTGRHLPGTTMICISLSSVANTKENGMIVVIAIPTLVITTYSHVLPAILKMRQMETTMEYPVISTTVMLVTIVIPMEKNDEKSI